MPQWLCGSGTPTVGRGHYHKKDDVASGRKRCVRRWVSVLISETNISHRCIYDNKSLLFAFIMEFTFNLAASSIASNLYFMYVPSHLTSIAPTNSLTNATHNLTTIFAIINRSLDLAHNTKIYICLGGIYIYIEPSWPLDNQDARQEPLINMFHIVFARARLFVADLFMVDLVHLPAQHANQHQPASLRRERDILRVYVDCNRFDRTEAPVSL